MNDMLEPTPHSEEGTAYQTAEPRINDHFAGRLADLVLKPGRLMANVTESPRWWQAGLLIFVLMTAFSWLILPISGPEQMEMMRESRMTQFMPEGGWEEAYAEALDPAPVSRLLKSAGAGVSTWVMMLIVSVVLGFFAKMSGGQGKMKQALGVVHWGSLIPFGLLILIKAPLILVTESVTQVNLGLAALLPDADPASPLFQILVNFGDFFTWWGLALLIIGFRTAYRMTTGAAAVSVLLPWALMTAVPVGLGLLFM